MSEYSKLADELERRQNERAVKYVYFLLAGTGAGLAFAVQKLDGQTFDLPGLLCLGGALAWLISLILGCLSLEHEVLMTAQNVAIAKHYADTEGTEKGPDTTKIARLRKKFDRHSDRANGYQLWQVRMLILGVLLLLFWRMVEMLPPLDPSEAPPPPRLQHQSPGDAQPSRRAPSSRGQETQSRCPSGS
ncbi:hypothetical protein K7564_04340 [Stenotrophomonas maltophilia]|nr:hypothetical protein K7564_04340 [Stenotrophomonas maltophilia]